MDKASYDAAIVARLGEGVRVPFRDVSIKSGGRCRMAATTMWTRGLALTSSRPPSEAGLSRAPVR